MRLVLWMSVFAIVFVAATPVAGRDMMDPAGTVNAFYGALASGDIALAKRLLAADVLIYEAGFQETSRDEYAAQHLKADIAFLSGMHMRVLDQKAAVHGDVGWVTTRLRLISLSTEKPKDLFVTQTVVLTRIAGGWQIVHVHKSSGPAEQQANGASTRQ